MIHPTAVVDPSAEIASDVEVGPYACVGPQVTIAAGCKVMQHASIVANTVLGNDNVIYPGAVIGADPQDKKYKGEEVWLNVGSGNTFREHVTINRGTGLGGGETRIGDRCLLMAGSHVAHDCLLGNDIIMANSVLLGGHVVVEDQAGFGGLSAVHHYATVGRLAFVGGMTRITTDSPPFLMVEGNPSRVRAINRVGLKRASFSDDTIMWLKEAQRLLYNNNMIRSEAFALLEQRGPVPDEGLHLRAFLRSMENGRQGRSRQP
ncbi:MAG TPA: acyl-ACP--UDP-N-acetylglucosamine O-acyltransferase [Planctomycetes bacterium]|nr:acyl-ACP--UDP-N-acetylglucosamine O-acyltransferase [Planctomycetota bacterium]HIN81122.1 acyl-ACP--UDP-N-acetylglucosamine O-acyltransferase [Planctomycetota bacterium]